MPKKISEVAKEATILDYEVTMLASVDVALFYNHTQSGASK